VTNYKFRIGDIVVPLSGSSKGEPIKIKGYLHEFSDPIYEAVGVAWGETNLMLYSEYLDIMFKADFEAYIETVGVLCDLNLAKRVFKHGWQARESRINR